MDSKDCRRCYHWQGYGYCAIEDTAHTDCEWFVDTEDIDAYFNRADGEPALDGLATPRPGKKD